MRSPAPCRLPPTRGPDAAWIPVQDSAAARDGWRDVNRILDGANISPGDHVVDLGAGAGLLTLGALARVGPDGTVSAIDRDEAALRAVRPAGFGAAGTLHRVVADATRLPLGDGQADAIVARNTLVHLLDLTGALDEAARILRPGGRLSASDPVLARRHHDAELTTLAPPQRRMIEDLLRIATPATRAIGRFDELALAARAKAAGFTALTTSCGQGFGRLADRAAVDRYLHRPYPGAQSQIDIIDRHLGQDLARRYVDAWHQAVDRQRVITIRTPTVYLTATRRDRQTSTP